MKVALIIALAVLGGACARPLASKPSENACEFSTLRAISADTRAADNKTFCGTLRTYNFYNMNTLYDVVPSDLRQALDQPALQFEDEDVSRFLRGRSMEDGKQVWVVGRIEIDRLCYKADQQPRCVPLTKPIYVRPSEVRLLDEKTR